MCDVDKKRVDFPGCWSSLRLCPGVLSSYFMSDSSVEVVGVWSERLTSGSFSNRGENQCPWHFLSSFSDKYKAISFLGIWPRQSSTSTFTIDIHPHMVKKGCDICELKFQGLMSQPLVLWSIFWTQTNRIDPLVNFLCFNGGIRCRKCWIS